MSSVCPTPASPGYLARNEIICYRCGKPGHIQIDCQQVFLRCADDNPTSTPTLPANPPALHRGANTSAAHTPKHFVPKRVAALLAREYNEALGRVDFGVMPSSSIGVGTNNDVSLNALVIEETPPSSLVGSRVPRSPIRRSNFDGILVDFYHISVETCENHKKI